MYLKSVTFKETSRCFNKGDRFEMQPLTLLVGDQGCGKSTLLEALQQNKILDLELTDDDKKGVKTFYFDSEKMNPRMKDPNLYTNLDGTNKGIGFGNALRSRFTSHGETLIAFTVEAIKKANNCIIFLDEPESALSLRNQFRLVDNIKNAIARDCQVIVATHCLVLIQSVENVLSLEQRKWLSSKEFIEQNKNIN